MDFIKNRGLFLQSFFISFFLLVLLQWSFYDVINVIARSLTVFLYESVWSIKWTVFDFHVRSTRNVCSYSEHILTNCVFLTVFPTIVDPFELSFSFSDTFPVFSAIEVFLYWTFRVCEKDIVFFAGLFWDPLRATFSSWVLLREYTKLTNWELPN